MNKACVFIAALLVLLAFALPSTGEELRPVLKLTFEDTFDGTQVDASKWQFQLGTGQSEGLNQWGNNEQQSYQPENAVVENGLLTLYARQEIKDGMPYTSARLCTRDLFSQCYGRFEARIRLPAGEGFWPAFWLMPQDQAYGTWAASGEIDIMEAKGRLPGITYHTIHFGGVWPENTYLLESYVLPKETGDGFHVYALEWTEKELRWYVDGVLAATQKRWNTKGYAYPAPFDKPFYMLLNLAVGGNFDQGRMPGSMGGPKEAQMEVDYVRVYQWEKE
jgi:beta-glucanase (GH16 family)